MKDEWITISEFIQKYKNDDWIVIPLVFEKGTKNLKEKKELIEKTLEKISKISCQLSELNINAKLVTASPVFTKYKYKIRTNRSGRIVKKKILWIKKYYDVDFPLVFCLVIPKKLISCCFEIYCILIRILKQLNC